MNFLKAAILIFLLKTNCADGSNILTEAVKNNDSETVHYIINNYDLRKINKKDFENASLIAAQNKNIEIFNLLEPYISRKFHRKVYQLLEQNHKKSYF